MREIVDKISETLLWEGISYYVEQNAKASDMLRDIHYIDDDVCNSIEKAEIFISDEFIVDTVQEKNDKYIIYFEMPIVIMFYDKKEQVLRVTTNVVGNCAIPNNDHFPYGAYDFDAMSHLQLLEHKCLVQDIQCVYEDVECDDVRV